MKETITIKNFGGLKDVTIPLNSINIFIGKQASGKSVTAKLIYFFRKVFEDIFDGLAEDKNHKEIDKEILEHFKIYFPVESWSKGNFFIKYETGDEYKVFKNEKKNLSNVGHISIERKTKDDIKVNYPKLINHISLSQKSISEYFQTEEGKKLVLTVKQQPKVLAKVLYQTGLNSMAKPFGLQIFVPAGRSFFSNIQSNVFSLIKGGNSIDPFLIEFGVTYENFKKFENNSEVEKSSKYIENFLLQVLDAKFLTDKTGDYLIHTDGRKINLLFCSSGQQEVLPLALILKNFVANLNSIETATNTLYIEEPEAHLFPSAQKKVVEMIATAHNLSKGKSQLVITTHSPYILTSFNNLLQAGQLLEKGVNERKLFKTVPEFEILKPGELNAYAFQDGGVMSLIDEETGLISADLLDQVSEEIAVQFDELLDIKS